MGSSLFREAASVQSLRALDGQAQEKQEMDSLSGGIASFHAKVQSWLQLRAVLPWDSA
jgi:hypothetical protein